jgi:hypothetical protein
MDGCITKPFTPARLKSLLSTLPPKPGHQPGNVR